MEVAFFNEGNAILVFALKVVVVVGVIMCGFAAVQFFNPRAFLTFLNSMIALDLSFIFCTLYARGFTIPRTLKGLRSSLRRQIRLSDEKDKEMILVLDKYLRSVQPASIEVGPFHCLHRLTTLTFIDVCVKNMVRAIIAYRRQ